MSDASKISSAHAEQIHADLRHPDDQGDITIDGEKFEWWADRDNVWFYEPGKDGEDTLKRFQASIHLREVNS